MSRRVFSHPHGIAWIRLLQSSELKSFHLSYSRSCHTPSPPPKSGGATTAVRKASQALSGADSDYSSLLQVIKDAIIGADMVGNNNTGGGLSKRRWVEAGGVECGRRGVGSLPPDCGNAGESGECRHLEGTTDGVVRDVSVIVCKVTEIVRATEGNVPMEEALERSGFVFDEEVVEKVLKRCFKVGCSAIRFFNWVRHRSEFRHTTDTYNTMIYIAGEAKEFGLVNKLFEEMEAGSVPADVKTWTIIISSYVQAKKTGEALMAFDKMKKAGIEPDETAYRLIIHRLCNVGKAEIAAEFYKEMALKNMEVDVRLYKLLLKSLCKSGDLAAVRSICDDMLNVAQIPATEVYCRLMMCFCIAGKIEDALKLFREMKEKNVAFSSEHFEVILEGLCKANRISDALELLDILKLKNVLDGRMYGHIVDLYLRRNDVNKALETLETMETLGFSPTAKTYNDSVQRLVKLNNYEQANRLFEGMLYKGIKPDVTTMTAVVVGYVHQNHIPKAAEAFDSMVKSNIKPSRTFYCAYIRELCRARKPGEAFRILQEMCHDEINPGNELFQLVLSSLKNIGDLENAENLEKMMKRLLVEQEIINLPDNSVVSFNRTEVRGEMSDCSGRKVLVSDPNTLVCSLEALDKDHVRPEIKEICRIVSSSKDLASMGDVFSKKSVNFTPDIVLEVISNCQAYGHSALLFFYWVAQQDGYKHTSETYNLAIKISGRAKNFRAMRMLFAEMKRKGLPVTANTWSIIIASYGRVGLTEMALKKFSEMKLEGYMPSGSTYKYLIIFLCGKKGCKVDEALEIFNEMLRMHHLPDKELVEIFLCCLCETGKPADAKRVVQSIIMRGFPLQFGYAILTKALSRAEKLEEALALEGEIEALGCKVDHYVYGSLVHGLLRDGRVEEAWQKVETMKQVGKEPTVHVYTDFIIHYLKVGDTEKAFKVYDDIEKAGYKPTVVTYSALIRGYIDKEMVDEAWSIFDKMKSEGPYPDYKTYTMILNRLCKIGHSEKALPLLSEMLDNGIFPSSHNFRTVLFGLNREGKSELASTVQQKKWDLKRQRIGSQKPNFQ